jgi:hypothetical protein
MERAVLLAMGLALLYVRTSPMRFIKMPLSVRKQLATSERSPAPTRATIQPNINLEPKEDCAHADSNRLSLIITTMRSVNKVILVGHLAADPEHPTRPEDVSLSAAIHRESTSDGVKKEVTDYHRVSWKAGTVRKLPREGQGVRRGHHLNRAYERTANGSTSRDPRGRSEHADLEKKGGVSNVSIDAVEPAHSE